MLCAFAADQTPRASPQMRSAIAQNPTPIASFFNFKHFPGCSNHQHPDRTCIASTFQDWVHQHGCTLLTGVLCSWENTFARTIEIIERSVTLSVIRRASSAALTRGNKRLEWGSGGCSTALPPHLAENASTRHTTDVSAVLTTRSWKGALSSGPVTLPSL